jgi:hypothetical protein
MKMDDVSDLKHSLKARKTAKGHGAWIFLTLLLPSFASKVGSQNSLPAIQVDSDKAPYPQHSRPYLRVVAAPPLRFDDPEPPPDLSARPPAGGPPKLPEKGEAKPDVILPKPAPAAQSAGSTLTIESRVAAAPAAPTAAAAPAAPSSLPILPDDVHPPVRAEDFLPYFQYPGGRSGRTGDGTSPPAAASLPPSTATYTEGN